jgi:hypothetical protein
VKINMNLNIDMDMGRDTDKNLNIDHVCIHIHTHVHFYVHVTNIPMFMFMGEFCYSYFNGKRLTSNAYFCHKSQGITFKVTFPANRELSLLITKRMKTKDSFQLWRSCNFTPIHSLTGPVGQPYASRLGGQRFASRETQTHIGTKFLLLSSCYIGDPNVIDHWPGPRLCSHQQWEASIVMPKSDFKFCRILVELFMFEIPRNRLPTNIDCGEYKIEP